MSIASAPLSDGVSSVKSDAEPDNAFWSQHLDHISLAQRLKLLVSKDLLPALRDRVSELSHDSLSREEDGRCRMEDSYSALPGCDSERQLSQCDNEEKSHCGSSSEGNTDICRMSTNSDCMTETLHNNNNGACGLSQFPPGFKSSVGVKEENFDDWLRSSSDVIDGNANPDLPALRVKEENTDVRDGDLDHLVLKERLKMLISRKLLSLTNPAVEDSSRSSPQGFAHGCNEKREENAVANNKFQSPERTDYVLCRTLEMYSSNGALSGSFVTDCQMSPKLSDSVNGTEQEGEGTSLSEDLPMQLDSHAGQRYLHQNANTAHKTTALILKKVKDEPGENVDIHNSNSSAMTKQSTSFMPAKIEPVYGEGHGNELESMPLHDRVKLLLTSGKDFGSISRDYESLKKVPASGSECSWLNSESSGSIHINRPRKRKKTITDSVETALEEDLPGLIKILIEKGVTLDEIKLYGETGSDEALDELLCEDGFTELETVVSKLFSQRHSILKFSPVCCTKASRTSYCLDCLISLIEQTRYLQFRKWPVEWGWSRDLQSFIFIFERHNRIVLERPEYGYATYFFELLDSIPVDWQIKRLVTAMKLTIFSRISLIENRALKVGEDLSEGEAKVLMDYGWVPNTGLGTMLNYCDRVVHDRKSEKDSSEWRSKIGKLLVDGYNGGTLVAANIPKKIGTESQVKVEF